MTNRLSRYSDNPEKVFAFQSVNQLMILNEEQFWQQMTRSAVKHRVSDYGFATDSYERMFDEVIPDYSQKALRCTRVALLLAGATDFSDLAVSQIAADAKALSVWDSEVPILVGRLLLSDIGKCQLRAKIRRTFVLGEIGDLVSLPILAQMTANSGELRDEAIRSMRSIAIRAGIAIVPPDVASSETWKEWAKETAPRVR